MVKKEVNKVGSEKKGDKLEKVGVKSRRNPTQISVWRGSYKDCCVGKVNNKKEFKWVLNKRSNIMRGGA